MTELFQSSDRLFENILAIDYRRLLAKSLFDNLFNWLVAKMNLVILPEELKTGRA